ncbi:LPS export ABC transporter periplasmic protein LptC [Orbaceae bacterium ESL0721]|nr:LPS export ABC transporter periplasmic protein LptC [Orbaceae bacterium ESL0721]
MNKKNLSCILLIILALAIYYYHTENEKQESITTTTVSDQPIYQSDDMTTDIYDISGNLLYKITSNNVKYFDTTDSTEFESPNFTLYDHEQIATWHIQAKQATLTHDKLLYLYHDVELFNLVPNSQLQQVKTDNAKVDLTTQNVTSKDKVVIQGEGFYSTGVGLFGDLHAKTAKILENVKTFYNTEAK